MIEEILVMHHSHTDIGYTHPQPVWWELSRRFIDEALDLCEETAAWPEACRMRWTCESTEPVLHWLARAAARDLDRFKSLVQAGQISVAGFPWNFIGIMDLEQYARILAPIGRVRAELGAPVRSVIHHDVTGLSWPLTQMLLDAKIELVLVGINIHYGGFPLRRPLAFRWQGSDGRSILAFNGPAYTMFDTRGRTDRFSIESMAEGLRAYLRTLPQDYPYDFAFLTATHAPFFWDNNPPNPALPRLVREWNAEGRTPAIRLATPEMLLERILRQPAQTIPTHAGDWTDYWTFGVGSDAFSTRVGQQVRSRLAAADLARLAVGHRNPEDDQRLANGYRSLNLWAEHTWSADVSMSYSNSVITADQEAHKASYLYQARSEALLLMRDQLEALARNPGHEHGLNGILAFNPAPLARREVLRVPTEWLAGEWHHFSSSVMRLDQLLECAELDRGGALVGPVDVPAFGWRIIPIAELQPAPLADGVAAEPRCLESPFYRLTFDPANGRVTSLLDKIQGWEILDQDGEWSFFEPVHETVDPDRHAIRHPRYGHDAYFKVNYDRIFRDEDCWEPDWPALRSRPQHLIACEVECTPLGATLVRRWEAFGLENLEQRITLMAHRPVVEVRTSFVMPRRLAAEAYYLPIPLNLLGWDAHFDSGELPVHFEREQLLGSCRDWVAVSRWICMHNSEHGVTLACPDAPLAQPAGFGWGKHRRRIDDRRRCLLLAWPADNYWDCNYPAAQPGPVSARYELRSHGPYDPMAATLAGIEAQTAIEIHPVVGAADRLSGTVVAVDGDGVVLLHAGTADGAAVVRLANVTDLPALARVRLPERAIVAACRRDTLGRDGQPERVEHGSAIVDVPPRAILALALREG